MRDACDGMQQTRVVHGRLSFCAHNRPHLSVQDCQKLPAAVGAVVRQRNVDGERRAVVVERVPRPCTATVAPHENLVWHDLHILGRHRACAPHKLARECTQCSRGLMAYKGN